MRAARRRLVVLVVSFAVMAAGGLRVCQAYSYDVAPIFCDGVDDDAGVSFLCSLPEDGTKDPLSGRDRVSNACGVHVVRTIAPRVTAERSPERVSRARAPGRFKRFFPLSSEPSEDSAESH